MKFLLFFLLLPNLCLAQTVFIQPEEALKINFSSSEEVVEDNKKLSPESSKALQDKLGYAVKENWRYFVAKSGGKVDGYAVIDSEIGKTEPITMMTFISPQGLVKGVEILIYRESHGSEVSQPNWRKQFSGKKSTDAFKIGDDIVNMTSATLSSRAVAKAVKRDLLVWSTFYSH